MTPLLTILILAASTPPTTITPHHHQEATMADNAGTAPRGVGGGSNRQNRRPNDPFRIDLIQNPTTRGSGYPVPRGNHPIATTRPTTFTEVTKRPA